MVPKRKHKFLAEVYLMKSHFSSGKERERAILYAPTQQHVKNFFMDRNRVLGWQVLMEIIIK